MSVSIICMSISIICVSMSTICILLYVCLCLLSVYLFLHICMPVSTIHITMSTIFIYVSTICKSVSAIYVCVLPEATSMVWETSSGILWFNQTRLNFSYLNTRSKLQKSATIVLGYPQRMIFRDDCTDLFSPFSCIQTALNTKIGLFLCLII